MEKQPVASTPLTANQSFQEMLINNVGLDMVYIPGGSFRMGSPEDEEGRYDNEGPQHKVTVQPFYLGKYPVTQAQWRAVATLSQMDRKLNLSPSYFESDDCPVEGVSWDDAIEFCNMLSLYSRKEYRLPSEAEWEYACRAGTTTPFSFGNTLTKDQANFDRTIGKTTPVGQYPANAFGLYDMHGNVLEWCEDSWHKSYKGAPTDGSIWTDNSAWIDGSPNNRLLRGGSWFSSPRYCRSAARIYRPRDFRSLYFGFRVCCVPPRIPS